MTLYFIWFYNKHTTVITVLLLRAKMGLHSQTSTKQERMSLPAGLHKNQQTNKQASNLNMFVPMYCIHI